MKAEENKNLKRDQGYLKCLGLEILSNLDATRLSNADNQT